MPGYCDPPKETRFKPGNPGGPGAPKGGNLTAILRRFMEEVDPKTKTTYGERVVKALVKGAIKGRPAATNQLWDRVEGKVTQPVSVEPPRPTPEDVKAGLKERHRARSRKA